MVSQHTVGLQVVEEVVSQRPDLFFSVEILVTISREVAIVALGASRRGRRGRFRGKAGLSRHDTVEAKSARRRRGAIFSRWTRASGALSYQLSQPIPFSGGTFHEESDP